MIFLKIICDFTSCEINNSVYFYQTDPQIENYSPYEKCFSTWFFIAAAFQSKIWHGNPIPTIFDQRATLYRLVALRFFHSMQDLVLAMLMYPILSMLKRKTKDFRINKNIEFSFWSGFISRQICS